MTPEQKKAFTPVAVGMCIFAIITGVNTCLSSAYVLFAAKLNVSTTMVVLANSCMTLGTFTLNQFSGGFMTKFGPRKSMMIAFGGAALGFLVLAFAPNVYVVWVGYACISCIQAFGQVNCIGAVVRLWVAPKYQGKYIGIFAGISVLGSSFWQVLGGVLFDNIGLSSAFLALIPILLIPAAIAIALVKDDPAACGVKPIGWSAEGEAAAAAAAEAKAQAKEQAAKRSFNPFKTKTFWICGLAALLTVIVNSSLSLMTTSLQMIGMSATTASSISSVATLLAFPMNMVAGYLVDKIGATKTSTLFYGSIVVMSVFSFLFFMTGNVIILVIYVVANAFCRPYSNVRMYMSSELFGEDATRVQPRIMSFTNIGTVFITPMIQSLAEAWGGYTYVTLVWAVAAVVIAALWIAASSVGKKEIPALRAAEE